MVATVRVDDEADRIAQRAERVRVDNEHLMPIDASALGDGDIEDLRWFWHDAPAECGVCSNFGAMCDAVLVYGSAAHAHAKELARERSARTRALAKKQKRIAESQAERARVGALRKTHELAARASYSADVGHGVVMGVDSALEDAATEILTRDEMHDLRLPPDTRFDGRVTATGKQSIVTAWEDPMHDGMLGFPRRDRRIDPEGPTPRIWRNPPEGSVERANRIRATLVGAGIEAALVLFAVYGPARGDDLTRALRKRFGDLAEIVVTVARATGKGEDPRMLALSRTTDASFVRMQKGRAEKLIERAGRDYVEAKR